jgi:hypothetical protein
MDRFSLASPIVKEAIILLRFILIEAGLMYVVGHLWDEWNPYE